MRYATRPKVPELTRPLRRERMKRRDEDWPHTTNAPRRAAPLSVLEVGSPVAFAQEGDSRVLVRRTSPAAFGYMAAVKVCE
jgi:hypothetical protein